MPNRLPLLTTAAVVSVLTFGFIRYVCGDAADGAAASVPVKPSWTGFPGVPADPPGGRRPGHAEQGSSNPPAGTPANADGHCATPGPSPGAPNSGRGIFQAAGSSAGGARNSRARETLGRPPPAAAGNVSEAELQWRAARVEQEANHELKRLVALLDLDEEQQDRIFRTLARRSTDWHPLMQPSTVIGGGDNRVADNGSSINQPSSSSTGSGETSSAKDPDTVTATPLPSQDSNHTHHDSSATSPQSGSETPLTDDLAGDLTPAQQAELAEDEIQRQEWWESIIPRLLPDEEDDEIYASPDTSSGDDPETNSPPSP